MPRKLMYILLILLFAANLAAQESYVIDSVCVGSTRTYRIEGEKGSTYEWHLQDTLGNELTVSNSSGIPFKEINSEGDSIWGSDIEILWDVIDEFVLSTYQFSMHGCDTLEHGYVRVFDLPVVDAGDDQIVCDNQSIQLSTDTAWNYSSLLWTTSGDGTFDFEDQLHPTYYPGAQDSISGDVELILTANGIAQNGTCTPVLDTMVIQIGGPKVEFAFTNLLCYHDNSGTIKANVSDGIEPYTYAWSGPGGYTSAQNSIYNLAAGMYIVTVTDDTGCMVKDSIEITEPQELLAEIVADFTESCENETFRLDGNPSGETGAYTHLWTGNGAIYLNAADIVNPEFSNAPGGTYTLVYEVEDENGCAATDTVSLSILSPTESTVDTLICENSPGFSWNGINIVTHIDSIYTAYLTGINGCDSIVSLAVTVIPEVNVGITIAANSTEIVEGEEVMLTAIPENGGSNPVYAWFVNGVEILGETSVSFTYTPEDGDEIYATLTSDMECAVSAPAASNIVTLTVVANAGELTVISRPVPVDCYGESTGSVELIVSGGTGSYNFVWTGPNGFTSTDEDINNLVAGIYEVVISDSDSKSKKDTIVITEPTAPLTLTAATGNDDAGPGLTGNVNLNIEGGTGPYNVVWTGPGGFTSTEEDINNLGAGEYTVWVTDANNCMQAESYTIITDGSTASISCPPDYDGYKCLSEVHPVFIYYKEFINAGGLAFSDCGIDTTTFSGLEISRNGTCPTYITRQYSVWDSCGIELKCTREIRVNDDILPEIICPPDRNFECMSDLPPVYASLSEFIKAGGLVNDNCAIAPSSFTLLSADTIENVENVIVTRRYAIQDSCGNQSYCSQSLHIKDTIPPDAVCNSITVYLDETGNVVLSDIELSEISAGSSDNCTLPEDLNISVSTNEFDCTWTGDVKIVNVMVTDLAGNQSVCSANVIVKDTTPPTALCRDTVVYLDENGMGSVTVSMIDNHSFDNCEIDTMFISNSNFTCENTGDNLVTLTVIDNELNSSECTANVTVIDQIAPTVFCKDITIQLDHNAYYLLDYTEILVDAFDECGIESFYLSKYEFDCADIGINQIKLTAVDVNGNENSCIAEVTILGNIAPVAENDTVYMVMNSSIDINVADNDYDNKSNIVSSSVSTTVTPKRGAAKVNPVTGIVTYTPEKDFTGRDVMTYSICDDGIPCEPMCTKAKVVIYVLDVNQPPIAENDEFTMTCYYLTENLMQNDHDPDSYIFYADTIPVQDPENGTVTIQPNGTFTYLPETNFFGVDSFIYRICDIGIPPLCDEATVYISVLEDTDCDGVANWADIDDDNDGILDVDEGDMTIDTDGDGIYDSLDIDSDNDGIPDNIEWQTEANGGYIPPTGNDSNSNGWDDAYDTDSGGTYYKPFDTDGNTVPDYLDTDSDGDGVWDYVEGHDINADGIPDVERFFTDSDYDGLDDAYDIYNDISQQPSSPDNEVGSNAPLQDFDLDGIRDWRDVNDDEDEFSTVDEDWNNDGDYRNDDMDLDGHPDYLDVDTDCELFIPEGFSPNGDGIHDFFQIFCIQRYPDAKLMIFNRAGNKLFEKEHYGNMDYWGTDQDAWWWGTSDNRWTFGKATLPAGNYVYIVQLGGKETRTGTVMISY